MRPSHGNIEPVKAFAGYNEIAAIQYGDVCVVCGHAMLQAAYNAQADEGIEFTAGVGRQPIAVPRPNGQGILHAKVDGIRIGHAFVAPIPFEIAAGFAFGVDILHRPHQSEQPMQPLGMKARFAKCQCIAENAAAARFGLGLACGNLFPQAFTMLGGLAFDFRR